jgi:hypothetical protein
MAIQLPGASTGAAASGRGRRIGVRGRVDTTRTVAALLAVLLLGGCDRFGGDGSGTGGTRAGGDTGGAFGPPASPAAYRQLLATVGTPVSRTIAGVAEARSMTALLARLGRAERAAGQAAERLGQTVAPEDLRAEHADLVQAFKRLHGDLGGLRDAVEGHQLCAASVVMARLGKADGLAAVRDAGTALTGRGRAQGYAFGLLVPATSREQHRRLRTGQLVRAGSRTGRGELKVDNGGNRDAVVTLAVGKRPVVSVYVRKGSKHTVGGVRDGTYRVYYTTGVDWDGKARVFTRGCAFARFDDTLKFTTTQSATRVEWVTWTITLQPVSGGTARTSDVAPDDFPAV